MISNPNFDRQVSQYRETAQQAGIEGSVYIDVDPANGFIRVKLKVTPLEQRANLTAGFSQSLEMMANWLGLHCYRQK